MTRYSPGKRTVEGLEIHACRFLLRIVSVRLVIIYGAPGDIDAVFVRHAVAATGAWGLRAGGKRVPHRFDNCKLFGRERIRQALRCTGKVLSDLLRCRHAVEHDRDFWRVPDPAESSLKLSMGRTFLSVWQGVNEIAGR